MAFTVGLGIGDVEKDDLYSYEIQQYWFIIFVIPIGISLVQVLLLMFIFPYDTPPVLKEKGEYGTL